MTEFKGKKTAVALGTFDGLHKGHLSVINEAVMQRDNGLLPVILLFSDHPSKIISGSAPKELFSGIIKEKEIMKTGCQKYIIPFEKIRNMTPGEFVRDVLKNELNAAFVSCGFNFRFGKNCSGDTQMLGELCKQYEITLAVSGEVKYNGEGISSTVIRKSIENGEIEKANSMLGRYFSYAFEVVTGDRIGGKILGFPTINQLFPEEHIVPKYGVYASAAVVEGKLYPAMTNIGKRPTVGGSHPRSETCILGYSGNLYGTFTEVKLISYLREEKKFPSLEALSEQMKKDSVKAKEIFSEVFR